MADSSWKSISPVSVVEEKSSLRSWQRLLKRIAVFSIATLWRLATKFVGAGILACGVYVESSIAQASAEQVVETDPSPTILLGEEYAAYEEASRGARLRRPIWKQALLYLPSRIADAIDVVRADVGVGPASGAVVRLTSYGQVGYRTMAPASLRIGLNGRHIPVFLEHSSEFGVGPFYVESLDREVTPLEVGGGLDLFFVGAYLGLSVDELADFLGGWMGFDFKEDDF